MGKRYIKNSLIVASAIGTFCWVLFKYIIQENDPPSLWWCIVSFIIAIIGTDLIKGKVTLKFKK